MIRGDDHVNNTPRQINLYRALGADLPHFAHVPMILGADGQRLSKRHGAVSVLQYRDEGYLPDALVNYLARLGWSHGDEEMFSREQLVEWFDLEHVSRSPARWDPEKLKWLNGEYLKRIPAAELVEGIRARNPAVHAEIVEAMDPVAMTAVGQGELLAPGRARGVPARTGLARDHGSRRGRAVPGRQGAGHRGRSCRARSSPSSGARPASRPPCRRS